MIVQFKSRLIETLEKFTNLNQLTNQDDSLSGESIGYLLGMGFVVVMIGALFVYLAYLCSCWNFYEYFMRYFVSEPYCNCIYCYYTCCSSCLDQLALRDIQRAKNKSQIYIQDLVTTADGRVVHLSNLRPLNTARAQLAQPSTSQIV